jgi:hypothetical protein
MPRSAHRRFNTGPKGVLADYNDSQTQEADDRRHQAAIELAEAQRLSYAFSSRAPDEYDLPLENRESPSSPRLDRRPGSDHTGPPLMIHPDAHADTADGSESCDDSSLFESDADFIEEYEATRRAALLSEASTVDCHLATAQSFCRLVDGAPICLVLLEEPSPVSAELRLLLQALCRRRRYRLVHAVAAVLEPDFDTIALPALQVYRDGKHVETLLRVHELRRAPLFSRGGADAPGASGLPAREGELGRVAVAVDDLAAVVDSALKTHDG